MNAIFYYASMVRYATFALLLAPVITQYWFDQNYFSLCFMVIVAIVQLLALRNGAPQSIPSGPPLNIATEFLMAPATIAMTMIALMDVSSEVMRALFFVNCLLLGASCLARGSLMILRRMEIIPDE